MKDRKNGIHAWIICLGCLAAEFVVVGLVCNLLGSFFPYMQTELGFSNTQTSSLLTVRSLSNAVFALLLKKYYDRLDVKAGLALTVIAAGAAFATLSVNKSYVLCVILTSVLGATVSLGGIYGVTLIITRWFRTGSTTAISIAACGSGLATLTVSPVLTSALEKSGLAGGFRLAALISFVCAVFIILTLKNYPDGAAGATDSVRAADAAGTDGAHAGEKQAAQASASDSRTGPRTNAQTSRRHLVMRLWVILAVLLGCTASNCTTAHIALLFTEKGFGPELTAISISALGIALIISKFTFGAMADRFGGKNVILASCAAGFVGELMLAFIFSPSLAWSFAAMLLTCFGLVAASLGTPLLARALFGEDSFNDVLKDLQAYPVIGPVLLGTAPGLLADITGSYVPSYIAFAAMLLLSGVIYFACYRAAEKTGE